MDRKYDKVEFYTPDGWKSYDRERTYKVLILDEVDNEIIFNGYSSTPSISNYIGWSGGYSFSIDLAFGSAQKVTNKI